MRVPSSLLAAGLAAALVACSSTSPQRATSPGTTPASTPGSAASWTTYFHDAGRSGATTDGPAAPATVRRQWVSPALDGAIYAQPLVAGSRVIVATENDTVFALDATTGRVQWSRHLGTPVSGNSLPCGNVDPVGITSTPVVDAGAGRVYAVGMVQPARHTLFALDLATGSLIASTGADAPGADPKTHNQRGALALTGGEVLVPFGGRYGDCGIYHGQLTAVPVTANAFGSPGSYTLPTGREGGFWAPPGPVVSADGTIFLTSGNSASAGSYDYADSVVHLSAALKLVDSFAPTDWATLNSVDSDLGSTGPVLVGGNRVFQVGKAGIGYLLDAGLLGGLGGQLSAGTVCHGAAMGAVSHTGTDLLVPCADGIAAVSVAGDRVAVRWTTASSTPGPAIVTAGAIWSVATGAGDLVALDPKTGRRLFSQHIGSVSSRFASPAAALGRVVVAADRTVIAFGA